MTVILTCPNCGGSLFEERNGLSHCLFCASDINFPSISDEVRLKLLQAATYRQNAEFDKSLTLYKEIIEGSKSSPISEAYFGAFLSEYTVLFELNEQENKKYPTFYSMQAVPVTENANYKIALRLASVHSDAFYTSYKRQAELIENARLEFYKIAKSAPKWDVFICFKKTGKNGNYTDDYLLAQRLYPMLLERYNVFYSEKSLNLLEYNKYEPNIYYALHSAKALIIICSEKDYVQSTWVKNEWTRFMDIHGSGAVIPLFTENCNPYEMPSEIKKLQGVQTKNIDWYVTLYNKLSSLITPKATERETNSSNTSLEKCIRNAELFIKINEYENAFLAYKEGIRIEPSDPRAWNGIIKYLTKNFTDLNEKTHIDYLNKAYVVLSKEDAENLRNCYQPYLDKKRVRQEEDAKRKALAEAEEQRRKDEEVKRKALAEAEKIKRKEDIARKRIANKAKLKKRLPIIIVAIIAVIISLVVFIIAINNKPQPSIYIYNQDDNGDIVINGVNTIDVTDLVIPSEIEGKKVVGIDNNSFANNNSLQSVVIPNSVTYIGSSAFKNCTNLESVELSSNLKTIESSAFINCTNLENLNLPNSVTYIGSSAFENCSSLKSLNLPHNLTAIKNLVFSNCTSLTSINIPSSVQSIGDSAFYYCNKLTSINIPSNATSLGDYVFAHCSKLSSINIPNSVTSIGNSAFNSCTNLTSITIPDSVTSIGGYAFYYCSKLTSMAIPSSITTIGDYTFAYCSKLTSITIPNSVTSIGNSAFNNCTNITSITIPSSVTSVGNEVFFGCTNLNVKWYYNPDLIIYNFRNYLTDVIIADDITKIKDSAFFYCSKLTNITIPSGVTTIGNSAFSYCSNLTSIDIPSGVTSIGDFAFYDCSSLASIIIPNSVTSVGNEAFFGCTNLNVKWYYNPALTSYEFSNSLTEVIIADNIINISDSAFSYCTSLTSIIIPSSVTTIGKYAFASSNITNINIPNSVQSIGDSAFYYCSKLTNINIPNSVLSIGDSAFAYCTSFTSITIPSSVTTIGNSVFSDCSNLTSINIPNSVTSIGNFFFYNCISLTSISIPSSINTIGNSTFANCTSLTSISIPNSVTSVGNSVFYYCSKLISIKIPSNVTTIGDSFFSYCINLTSITIPSSIISIGFSAFALCANLNKVYYNGTQEQYTATNINVDNKPFVDATKYYYSAAQPLTNGNYWYYSEDVITEW